MIRSRFASQLNDLNKEIIFMGALCEDIIGKSLGALTNSNDVTLTIFLKLITRLNKWNGILRRDV